MEPQLAINELVGVLQEVQDFLEGQIDVVDGDYGQPQANRAMQLDTMIRESLKKVGA